MILHLVAGSTQGTFINRLVDGLMRVEGAYSLVLMTEQTMVAVRDPWGFRPLVLGRRGSAWVVASETCALGLIGAEFVREVEPGEMVIVDHDGIQSHSSHSQGDRVGRVFLSTFTLRVQTRQSSGGLSTTTEFSWAVFSLKRTQLKRMS